MAHVMFPCYDEAPLTRGIGRFPRAFPAERARPGWEPASRPLRSGRRGQARGGAGLWFPDRPSLCVHAALRSPSFTQTGWAVPGTLTSTSLP